MAVREMPSKVNLEAFVRVSFQKPTRWFIFTSPRLYRIIAVTLRCFTSPHLLSTREPVVLHPTSRYTSKAALCCILISFAKISRNTAEQPTIISKSFWQKDHCEIWRPKGAEDSSTGGMSSFFTTPASQRKRKREEHPTTSAKRRVIDKSSHPKSQKADRPKASRDESISGSGSENEEPKNRRGDEISSSSSDDEDETGAEKRLRLAEQYLQSIKGTVDETGFDAEEIDRDLIAERLQEDVAETKGRLHRHIASSLDVRSATKTQFRANTLTTTGIAACAPYVYTVSKDLYLIKWELPKSLSPISKKKKTKPTRRRPTKLISTHGTKSRKNDQSYTHHTAPILCVAASTTGKFVATGGADRKLIIWSAENLKPLRVFTQHRDAVTSLAFRKGTNQLYSASKDRTIKTWSLDELAYVETLFGHQDEVLDVAAGSAERCISVGARDRTARLWKVVEETQLVFRGGGGGGSGRGGGSGEKERRTQQSRIDGQADEPRKKYAEGSIDRVALVDEDTFVTGSDNGSLSLWSLQKKKPVFTVPLAHGLDPALKPEEASAEKEPREDIVPERLPRWITALATVPYSDLVISGSWDGQVKLWKVGEGRRTLEAVGSVGSSGQDAEEGSHHLNGVVNDMSVYEKGERGKESVCVVAAVGTECRLGRWKKVQRGRNGAVVFDIQKKREKKIPSSTPGKVAGALDHEHTTNGV